MNLFDFVWISAFVLLVAVIFLTVKYRGQLLRNHELAARLGPIVDLDAEVRRVRQELDALATERERAGSEERDRRQKLNAQYAQAKSTYDHLSREVALLEENLEDMSFGLYTPHYTFESSESYKQELGRVFERKKVMIQAGRAAVCDTTWTVGGSSREGERMVKQSMKLMLRAFNGETDAAVAKVTWNNVTRMEERIRRAFDAINKTGTVHQIHITPQYMDLALAELRLTYEFAAKRREEQEAQRELRERMREEERAQRDFERAEKEAADEQTRYEKALVKARADVEAATGAELARATERLAEVEKRLAEAQAKMQRAMSMAQQTRCGYVYVISNLGAFGDNMHKIGMTRRLDPLDRVRELGDASVPFGFDVHAMIYSEDAPALEAAFHRQFEDRRVNRVNLKKEYFWVTLPEIEAFARQQGVAVDFVPLAEAQEFRQTCALRASAASGSTTSGPITRQTQQFHAPDSLFASTE